MTTKEEVLEKMVPGIPTNDMNKLIDDYCDIYWKTQDLSLEERPKSSRLAQLKKIEKIGDSGESEDFFDVHMKFMPSRTGTYDPNRREYTDVEWPNLRNTTSRRDRRVPTGLGENPNVRYDDTRSSPLGGEGRFSGREYSRPRQSSAPPPERPTFSGSRRSETYRSSFRPQAEFRRRESTAGPSRPSARFTTPEFTESESEPQREEPPLGPQQQQPWEVEPDENTYREYPPWWSNQRKYNFYKRREDAKGPRDLGPYDQPFLEEIPEFSPYIVTTDEDDELVVEPRTEGLQTYQRRTTRIHPGDIRWTNKESKADALRYWRSELVNMLKEDEPLAEPEMLNPFREGEGETSGIGEYDTERPPSMPDLEDASMPDIDDQDRGSDVGDIPAPFNLMPSRSQYSNRPAGSRYRNRNTAPPPSRRSGPSRRRGSSSRRSTVTTRTSRRIPIDFLPYDSKVRQEDTILDLDCTTKRTEEIDGWGRAMEKTALIEPSIQDMNAKEFSKYLGFFIRGNARQWYASEAATIRERHAQTAMDREPVNYQAQRQLFVELMEREFYKQFVGLDKDEQYEQKVVDKASAEAEYHLVNMQLCNLCYLQPFRCEWEYYFYKLTPQKQVELADLIFQKIPPIWGKMAKERFEHAKNLPPAPVVPGTTGTTTAPVPPIPPVATSGVGPQPQPSPPSVNPGNNYPAVDPNYYNLIPTIDPPQIRPHIALTIGGRFKIIEEIIAEQCKMQAQQDAIGPRGQYGGMICCDDPSIFVRPGQYGCGPQRGYSRRKRRQIKPYKKSYHKKRYRRKRRFPRRRRRYDRPFRPSRKRYRFKRSNKPFRRRFQRKYFRKRGKKSFSKKDMNCPRGKATCKCWLCKEEGHYANECPNKGKNKEQVKLLEQIHMMNYEPIETEISDISENESVYWMSTEEEDYSNNEIESSESEYEYAEFTESPGSDWESC